MSCGQRSGRPDTTLTYFWTGGSLSNSHPAGQPLPLSNHQSAATAQPHQTFSNVTFKSRPERFFCLPPIKVFACQDSPMWAAALCYVKNRFHLLFMRRFARDRCFRIKLALQTIHLLPMPLTEQHICRKTEMILKKKTTYKQTNKQTTALACAVFLSLQGISSFSPYL